MAIEWSDDLSTGVAEIDNQHKELFRRINDLFDACNQGKGKNEVAVVMEFLESYVVEHFGMEENYMKKYSYAGYSSHLANHTEFIKNFSVLKKDFEAEGPNADIVIRMNHLLVEWLINHIRKVDKALGAFLKTKTGA